MQNICVFERVEKKYRMSEEQYEMFVERAEDYIRGDEYGLHTIRNIYYDTPDYGLIRNSLEKPKYKEKFRVRGYGNITEESNIFLEIKKKYRGVVYKRRACLTFAEAEQYLEKRILPFESGQIMCEIDYFMSFYKPEPKVYLAYDRTAYEGLEDDGLRITIDRNIRSRNERLELGYDGECRLLDPGTYLMEIKVPAAYPLWLSGLLAELKLYPVSFSKYGTVYTKGVLAGDIFPMADTEFVRGNNYIQDERKEKEQCLQIYSAV